MGTNYYLKCKGCGTGIHHIGKVVAGPTGFITNYTRAEFRKLVKKKPELVIQNEYGDIVTTSELLEKYKKWNKEEWGDGGENGWC